MTNTSKIIEIIVPNPNVSWADWKVVHTCTQCGEGDPGVSHWLGMIVGYNLLKDLAGKNFDKTSLIGQELLGVYLCWKCIDENIETKDEWGGFASR